MGELIDKDAFAAKYIVPAERLGIALARKFKVPDVEEFASIAVCELGISIEQCDDPSWAVIKQRICEKLQREADKYHEEQKNRKEYKDERRRD